MRALVIAGVASGVGKTTVTLGLMAALRRRGLAVQAFKVGPDFIDPAFHALVTGRPSYTLDGWMCGREAVRATVARHAADADIAIIEGMMGCFDGIDGTSDDGSTAQIAKWLGAPVILVVDAGAASRSVAAVVLGCETFDPALDVAGVIANNTGGAIHARWVQDAIASRCRAVPLGALGRDAALVLPERHLGLVTAAEGPLTPAHQTRLAEAIDRAVDVDRLLRLASAAEGEGRTGPGDARPPVLAEPADVGRASPGPVRPSPSAARIAVARDIAFQFYYEENLALLREAGAELVFWSPETDPDVPDADGLYFGGGYPELRAKALSTNVAVRRGVRAFIERGGPVYAECGGLMYLAETLEDPEGGVYEMVGVLPAAVRMRPRTLSLGYATVTTTAPSILGPAGTVARGHEFHYSTLERVPLSVPRAYRLTDARGGERVEGYQIGSALSSYVHLHFASNPSVAEAFVRACAGARA
ncbi:MAG: cobyrinate a,c-diamide synthase [Candidatus Rokubacteria bacterium]|nr:cobyrinate a,c-diamide synthase [Candidatus Rokubacteria bacterium]